ncbi:hypothetical protein ACTFIZ_012196 [Dictyostelium cf. discoideum]
MRDYNTIIESGEFVFKTIRRHKRPTGHPGTAQAKPLVSQSLQQQNRVAHWRDTSSNGKEAGASGPSRSHKQAWTLLKTPNNKQTHYEYLPKLKKIYEDMMTNQFPQHNKFVPTRPKRNNDQNQE